MVNSSGVVDADLCYGAEVMVLLRAWLAVYLLLLPLFLCVLYVGHRRGSAPSHTDIFTFHLVAMEMVTILGSSCYSLGVQAKALSISRLGDNLFSVGVTGQMQFHILTCVERYLAVVHPIMYLRLKERGGVTVRNVNVAGVWLLSVAVGSVKAVPRTDDLDKLSMVGVTFVAVVIVSFCSISVLRVMTSSGPGEGGGALRRMNQSKRRAFFNMAAVTSILMLRFLVLAPAYLVYCLVAMETNAACLLTMAASWFYLPSSVVLPLMFLHKTRTLPKCSLRRSEPRNVLAQC